MKLNPVLVQCCRCQQIYGLVKPQGSAPGVAIEGACPKCGTKNQVRVPLADGNQGGVSPNKPLLPHPFPPTGARRALLIGVNYKGTPHQLRGCIYDAHNLQKLLVETYGWDPREMRMLVDDGSGNAGMPTLANIEEHLKWLAKDAHPGDTLFFSYSGHGTQVDDAHHWEEDGMNEAICPLDFGSPGGGLIIDDHIGDVIAKHLPEGVKLFSLMDCCHSGSALDLPYQWKKTRWHEAMNPFHCVCDAVMVSGCEDDQTSADAVDRYNLASGAMTTAFCDSLRQNPSASYKELHDMMEEHLKKNRHSQRPVLSSSQPFPISREFSLSDICPNLIQHPHMCPDTQQALRTVRKPFEPRPREMRGPLAQSLAASQMLPESMQSRGRRGVR